MKKNNLLRQIFAAIFLLLPLAAGLLLWERLPERMAIHWNIYGEPDGWAGRAVAVLLLPLVLLLLQGLSQLLSRREEGRTAAALRLWIIPVLSLVCGAVTYCPVFFPEMKPDGLMPLLLGLLFAILGNFLPKLPRSRTLGIKIKWTLESDENWYATHRFTGWLWSAGGMLMIFCALLPKKLLPAALLPLVLAMILLPVLYSWRYSRRKAQ